MCDHPNREAAMVTIKRDRSGEPTVWCDPCIAPLVRALNDGGLATVASCCGHGVQPGRISLADGTELTITGTCDACGGQGTYYGCLWCDGTGESFHRQRPVHPEGADNG